MTVDVEALWILQAMLDIPTLPPELRSLPYGAAQTKDWLSADPRVDALRARRLGGFEPRSGGSGSPIDSGRWRYQMWRS